MVDVMLADFGGNTGLCRIEVAAQRITQKSVVLMKNRDIWSPCSVRGTL